ncbi:MAG: hypothetical protein NC938_02985 [Candidatus Omnitrophica bacterium]|nr:hypothetical protein [Candidatus Omnitrophota bacterium]
MKKILKITSVMGVATLIKIFAGLIRAKFLAWQLGPIGIGLAGQAQMFSVFAVQLCSLNIAMGVTKGVSERLAKNDRASLPLVTDSANTFQFIAAMLFIVAVLPFTVPLTKFVFADAKYWPYFVGIALTTPFAVYLLGMATPIFYAFGKIADYTKLTILYTAVGLAILVVSVYFFGLDGIFVQIITLGLLSFLFSLYFLRKRLSFVPGYNFSLLRGREARAASVELFKYSVMSFLPGNVTMLVMLFIRGLFLKQYGIEANGFFQVAYALSAYYLPFVTNALWGHFYPEMCALGEKKDVNRSLNEFARFAIFASTAIAALCIIFRRYMILILFSSEFMKAYDLLAIQAIGDIFFVLFYMFNTSLIARKKFDGIIWIQTIGYNVALLGSYFVLRIIPFVDFRSFNIAIALTNILFVVAQAAYFHLDTGFSFTKHNIRSLVLSLAVLALLLAIPDGDLLAFLIKIAVLLGWIFLSVTKEEIRSLFSFMAEFFKKDNVPA